MLKCLLPLAMILSIIACTNKPTVKVLHPKNLKSQYFTIDPIKDTILKTAAGVFIKIPAGAFDEVTELEVKEAISMQQILLGGMTTESNGQPLQSGGMIYINGRNKKELKPKKPLTVLMPTNKIDSTMKLYKGVEKADGSVNWVDPEPLMSTPQTQVIDTGKILFMKNCSSCHAVNKSITGPALAGVEERVTDKKKLYDYIRNNNKILKEGDPYFSCLFEQWSKTPMNLFPNFSDAEIEAILRYARNETDSDYKNKIQQKEGMNPAACLTPCKDTIFYEDPPAIPPNVIDIMDASDNGTNPEKLEMILRRGFTDSEISDGYYKFQIKTVGWFNIDAGVRGLPNSEQCDMLVSVKNPELRTYMVVYVFFPDRKDLTVGELGNDGKYHFEKYQGKIPLFLGAKGVVLAFGNYREQFYYGTQSFVAEKSQEITVDVDPSSEDKLIRAIEEAAIEGIDVSIIKRKMKIIYHPCGETDSAVIK